MNVQLTEPDQDVAAIRAVIIEETHASLRRDFEGWADCFVHDHRTMDVSYAPSRGVLVFKGWDEVSGAMRNSMDNNPEPHDVDEERRDFDVSVSGDMAWARYRSSMFNSPHAKYPQIDSEQIRVLERLEGRWRIVYLAYAIVRAEQFAKPVVQVDQSARVIWATDKTLEALKDFEGLKIVAGRLQATDRQAQVSLQKTISRVANLRHIFCFESVRQPVNSLHHPCLLGSAERGGTLHCTVFARNGQINVTFNDSELVQSKINAASEIFALSRARADLRARL